MYFLAGQGCNDECPYTHKLPKDDRIPCKLSKKVCPGAHQCIFYHQGRAQARYPIRPDYIPIELRNAMLEYIMDTNGWDKTGFTPLTCSCQEVVDKTRNRG